MYDSQTALIANYINPITVFGNTVLSKGFLPISSQRTACLKAQRRSLMIFSIVWLTRNETSGTPIPSVSLWTSVPTANYMLL